LWHLAGFQEGPDLYYSGTPEFNYFRPKQLFQKTEIIIKKKKKEKNEKINLDPYPQ